MSANLKKLKVLIIDPHILIRQMLLRVIRDETDIQDLFTMVNSENTSTLLEIENLQPDLVFLGIESVDSRDFWLLKSIINMYPEIPVVLLTPLTPQGARTALKGLKVGAVDYITTPDTSQGVVLAERHFKKRVIPLVKAAAVINMQSDHGNQILLSEPSTVATQHKFKQKGAIDLVVIGGCLGGVRTLYDIISTLKEDMAVPVMIVQHMPKIYTNELAADLDIITPLNVREAKNKSILLPGQVYVAPGGYHTVLNNRGRRNIIKTHRGPREMKYRPSIDTLFKSAVNIYGDRVLGVILSGGGSDGVVGAEKVVAAGGEILVQSSRSSHLYDLPGQVQSVHASVKQYHSQQLGREILKRLKGRASSAGSYFIKKESNQLKNTISSSIFTE